jgi:hypothetical protein
MINKRLINTGEAAPAPLDPLQNFETVTYTGNGGTQKITGYIRKGAAFNGSSSHMDFPSPVPYTNTDMTFGCWVKLNSAFSSGFKTIIGAGNKSTGEGIIRLLLRYDSANSYKIEPVRSYSGNSYYTASSSYAAQTINAGSWYNIIYTYSASGNTAKIYINGSLISTTNLTTSSTDSTNSGVLALGQYRDGASSALFWDGSIDQVRIFDKALLEDNNGVDEIQALADETYADPKKSTTDYFDDGSGVALYELDEDALSSNFEQAAVFNGSSSYVSASIPFLNARVTSAVSLWIKYTDTGAYRSVFNDYSNTANFNHNIIVNQPSTGNVRFFSAYGGNTGYKIIESNGLTLNDGNWHHIVSTVDLSTNTLTGYVDGVSVGNVTVSTNAWTGTTQNLQIGRQESGSYFNGSVDQVRIYSSALDSTDVEKLYKESADVPTANLVAHYKLDGNATDETETYDGTASNVTYSAGVYGGTPTNVNFLGMAFQPDLVWVKQRSSPTRDHQLNDSLRGANKILYPNLAVAEDTAGGVGSAYFNSFDSNGFTVGSSPYYNGSSLDYVAWCWKAGGAAVSNTDGTITSQVSANTDAGFSIVKFTSPSTNTTGFTIGHGLSSAPDLIITKPTDAAVGWHVYSSAFSTPSQSYLQLQTTTAAATSDPNTWNNTAATSTVFSMKTGYAVGTSSETIAYCFHSVDFYQKVGSYTGTGASGNVVTTGFRPRFILLRKSNTTNNWDIFDSTRDTSTYVSKTLKANTSDAESTYPQGIYFQDNGFEPENTYFNDSGDTIIYLAIA